MVTMEMDSCVMNLLMPRQKKRDTRSLLRLFAGRHIRALVFCFDFVGVVSSIISLYIDIFLSLRSLYHFLRFYTTPYFTSTTVIFCAVTSLLLSTMSRIWATCAAVSASPEVITVRSARPDCKKQRQSAKPFALTSVSISFSALRSSRLEVSCWV